MGILLTKLDVLGGGNLFYEGHIYVKLCFVECVASVINGGFAQKSLSSPKTRENHVLLLVLACFTIKSSIL